MEWLREVLTKPFFPLQSIEERTIRKKLGEQDESYARSRRRGQNIAPSHPKSDERPPQWKKTLRNAEGLGVESDNSLPTKEIRRNREECQKMGVESAKRPP